MAKDNKIKPEIKEAKETKGEEIEVIEPVEVDVVESIEVVELKKGEEEAVEINKTPFDLDSWKPKTEIGRKVKNGEIRKIDEILDNGLKIMESEITDALVPNLSHELLLAGQSKGKFGGGKRRAFAQTQKKTREGNKIHFSTFTIVGNNDGYIGIGYGKAKETVPAREKSLKNAKLNIIKIRRGCGSWKCSCRESHSIPFQVEGKSGSVKIILIPAPKGTGLCVQSECIKILKMAGINDVWSRILGKTATRSNIISACFEALKNLTRMKTKEKDKETLGIREGNAR